MIILALILVWLIALTVWGGYWIVCFYREIGDLGAMVRELKERVDKLVA